MEVGLVWFMQTPEHIDAASHSGEAGWASGFAVRAGPISIGNYCLPSGQGIGQHIFL